MMPIGTSVRMTKCIPNVLIQRYVNSMRHGILLRIPKNGGHTGYCMVIF